MVCILYNSRALFVEERVHQERRLRKDAHLALKKAEDRSADLERQLESTSGENMDCALCGKYVFFICYVPSL